jgi:1-acyl-sn-glycerol-3-phosphate acyltransferase
MSVPIESRSRRSHRLRSAIGHAWLKMFGWQLEGGAPEARKAVVVAVPHTSNWDFPFTLAVAWALGIELRWVGKHTLFAPPFGAIMRSLGGVSVDRRGQNNAVGAIIDLLNRHDELMLVIAPEGTRGRVNRWRTGFYHMAVGADVPIVLGFLDYARKRGGLGEIFVPSGDLDKDMGLIAEFYAEIKGKHPNRQSPIVVATEAPQGIPKPSREAPATQE